MRSTFAYRADIDGLRATAVAAVVLYHVAPGVCPGGFVGVDVFFVISGFLITSIIRRDLDAGAFSIVAYLSRRARRILPPLIPVVAIVLAAGCLLDPTERRALIGDAAASIAFASNIRYAALFRDFAPEINRRPLLHLWSLAVEEHFYLVWPTVLVLLRPRRRARALLVLATLSSFAYCVHRTPLAPFATYVGSLTRLWEIGAGALLALGAAVPLPLCQNDESRSHHFDFREVVPFVGAAMIAASAFGFHERMVFPGAWAAVPVAGAVLVIGAGPRTWLARRVLARGGPRWLGRLSYPLYLWHWPMLTYLRVLAPAPPTPSTRFAVVAAAVGLAWASTRILDPRERSSASPLRAGPR